MLHACQLTFAGFLVARHLLGGGIVHVGTKGGDLDHLVFTASPVHHMHDAKASPNNESTPEQALDLFWRGVGRHVKILRPQTHHQVAYRPAHDIGFKTRLLEGVHHVEGAVIH